MRFVPLFAAGVSILLTGCGPVQKTKSYPAAADAPTPPQVYDDADLHWDIYKVLWLDDYQPSSSNEARLPALDEKQATSFLDETSLKWAAKNGCGTCHTNIPYLMARPLISRDDEALKTMTTVKKAMVEAYRKHSQAPLRAFYAAPAAASAAVNDGLTTGSMSEETRELFDAAWDLQSESGNWEYPLKDMLPFLERERRYVAYLAALGVGYLPKDYLETPKAREGVRKLFSFVKNNMPNKPHDKAVVLWASEKTPTLLSPEEKKNYQQLLLNLQRPDGGWALPTLGQWPRHDGPFDQAGGPSDGYATGLIATALCSSGFDRRRPQIAQALQWLKENQRVSGRWFTRSTYSDQFKGYVSNMATAYAMMALKKC